MTPAFFFGFCVGAACGWGLGCWVAWRVARFVLGHRVCGGAA